MTETVTIVVVSQRAGKGVSLVIPNVVKITLELQTELDAVGFDD